jgi:P-type conjugative transfer protein TrbJ
MKIRAHRAALAALALTLAEPASAQWAVIDAANLSQNVLTAARSLQQVTNQIQQLQNEAMMLENMGKNLSNLNFSNIGQITADLNQIGVLMNQAQGITYSQASVQAAYQARYPQQYAAGTGFPQLLSDAQARWQDSRAAYQQTMLVQAQIAQTVQADTAKLADLVTASQGAGGNLQVTQATNQLLALSIKQQLQLQTLLAAQGRAQALAGANNAEAEEEGRAAFVAFIGTGNAYTP